MNASFKEFFEWLQLFVFIQYVWNLSLAQGFCEHCFASVMYLKLSSLSLIVIRSQMVRPLLKLLSFIGESFVPFQKIISGHSAPTFGLKEVFKPLQFKVWSRGHLWEKKEGPFLDISDLSLIYIPVKWNHGRTMAGHGVGWDVFGLVFQCWGDVSQVLHPFWTLKKNIYRERVQIVPSFSCPYMKSSNPPEIERIKHSLPYFWKEPPVPAKDQQFWVLSRWLEDEFPFGFRPIFRVELLNFRGVSSR